MFTEEEQISGTWHGETYNSSARNNRPAHLALLPGGVGACFCADGCGIRANSNNNKKKGGNDVTNEEWVQSNVGLKEEHYANLINANIDQGYKALVDSARAKLDSMDSENTVHYLQEVYDGFLVYEVKMRVGGMKLYKQEYALNGNLIELKGTPEEVQRKVEYVTLAKGSGFVRTKFNNNVNKEDNMANETCTPCVKKKVDDLIANSQGRWTEEDRVMLETLSEAHLDKMKPVEITKEVEKIVEKTIEVNSLTDAQKAALAYGERLLKEKKEAMVQGIQANAGKENWPDEVLVNMDEVMLERVYNSVKKDEKVVDYSFNGYKKLSVNEGQQEPLLPPGIKFETVKK